MLETAIKFLRSHRGRQIRLVMDKKEVKITKFGDIFVPNWEVEQCESSAQFVRVPLSISDSLTVDS